MKAFTFYTSKKYFQRVMFSIMLTMALILTGLSVTNTYILERSVKHVREDSNLKVLTQIQYNLSYMNEIISHLSSFAYRDNFLIPLMFTEPLPMMDYIRGYREMSNLMESSSFLQSMAIYNASSQALYGSTSAFLVDGGATKSNMLNWLLHPAQPHPASRLIPVSVGQSEGRIDAFAFIVTDTYKPFAGDQSAIILYIKPDWVFDSLLKMNNVGSPGQGQVYIQSADGRLFSNEDRLPSGSQDQAAIAKLVDRDKASYGRQSGFVIGTVGQAKSMVTYMDGIGDWTILYVQPYNLLMKEVTDTRTKSVLITGAFLLLSIGVSIWLSYKLYDPIENMLRRLRPHLKQEQQDGNAKENELDLMSDQYLRLSAQLQEISSEQIVHKYYLRQFLADSQLFSHHDVMLLIEKHGLEISVTDPLLVCVLRIDHYDAYERNTPASSKKLNSFAIVNIAQEILSRFYSCEAVDIQGDQTVLILSGNKETMDIAQLKGLILQIQETIERYYRLSLSCGISDVIHQFPHLSSAYHQAYQWTLYRFMAGYKSIITTADIQENLANKRKALPAEIERKLSEALKKGQLTNAGSELERAFTLMATFPYEEMRRAVSDLAWVLENTAADIRSNRVVTVNVDVDRIHKIPQEQETLEEVYLAFLALCAQICEGQRPANVERNELIIGTVKELIEQKFADLNLNQQSIASTVKLTSAYVGKLFKDSCDVSITEYINEVRLQHAQELLLQSDDPITEIMDKCGYANQSYFFRLFKGKYGTTPKEYRIKKSIS